MIKKNKLIFDVESISLHGEAFAYGGIVVDENNEIIEKFALKSTDMEDKANEWVKENVIPNLRGIPTCKTAKELRDGFWEVYMKHKDTCEVWSDCNFPVETNFLSAVANDNMQEREFMMPYPLYDVCSFVDINIDRDKSGRGFGLRKHHPVDDSLSSFYCLIDSENYKKRMVI